MKVVDGCTACAKMAYNFSELSFIYPITPSSPMASQIDLMGSENQKNVFGDTVNVIEMQSEAGAAGAMHGALNAGVLASTFTASQGLLLMIPNMYKMAGEMLPGVIHVAARSLSTHALSIFGDHQDVYATRATGFCILASTNVQDAYNLAMIAHLSAIEGSLPFLHFFDGFRTSHEYNQIELISDKDIKSMINYEKVNEFRNRALNSGKAITKGTAQNEDIYFQVTEARNKDYLKMPDIVNTYMKRLNKIAGTSYKPFNYYGSKNAKKVIVAMGSVCDTIKNTIDMCKNDEYGLIEVHLYRPFSADYLKKVLPKSVRKIAVLDRTKESGSAGEPLYLDVLSALSDEKIKIVHGRYGLSSKNTTPSYIYDVYKMLDTKLVNNFVIGIDDDITNLSLKHFEFNYKENYKEFKIFGFGSDGLVSASKDMLKILGESSYVQGYFEYDSKKSGGVTISHLRTSKKLIKAPYYVTSPSLVVVSKDEYFKKFDCLDGLVTGGTLLVNTYRTEEEFNKFIPNEVKKYLIDNNIKVYLIDAGMLASKYGISGKISLIMESAILNLFGFDDYEKVLIKNVKKRFFTKGEDIVKANVSCIKESKYYLKECKIDGASSYDMKYGNTVFDYINSRRGNQLSTRDVYEMRDGTTRGGTSALEKRSMASMVPKWDKNRCIECGMCNIVCPHAVIRPFVIDKNDKYASDAKDSLDKKNKFIVAVSERDCTACGLCSNICPVKCLFWGEIDDKNQKRADDLFKNYENDVTSANNIKGVSLKKPLFEFSGACAGCGETPYIKLLTQIVGKRLVIANATGCSSIYGASCPSMPYNVSWGSSLFEDNAEYGYGMLRTYDKLHARALKELESNKAAANLYKFVKDNENDYEKINAVLDEAKKYVSSDLVNYLTPKSVWTIGGDGWAYDIGFGGLDHVLSSNKKVRIMVLDTEVYSNTGGQSSKSTHIGAVAEFADMGKDTYKKDLFKICMGYPNVYVGQISLGANMMQAIKTIKEAEEHDGPSIILAYSPCIEQGIKGGMSNSINEEKLAVMCGYVTLMRYFDGELHIDSAEPDFEKYDDFLRNEVRYNALILKDKEKADVLLEKNKNAAKERYEYYKKLLDK